METARSERLCDFMSQACGVGYRRVMAGWRNILIAVVRQPARTDLVYRRCHLAGVLDLEGPVAGCFGQEGERIEQAIAGFRRYKDPSCLEEGATLGERC